MSGFSRWFHRTPATTPNDTPALPSEATVIKASWFDEQLAISGGYTIEEVDKEVEAIVVWLIKKIQAAGPAHTLCERFQETYYLKERAGLTKAAGRAIIDRLSARVPDRLSVSITEKDDKRYEDISWYVFVKYTGSRAEQVQRPGLFGGF